MIPSLAMGLYIGATTGMWQLAFMSIASSGIAWYMSTKNKAKTQVQSPIEVTFRGRREVIAIDGLSLTRWRWLKSKALRQSVRQFVAQQVANQENLLAMREVLNIAPEQQLDSNLLLGVSANQPVWFHPRDAPHLLIIGPTGCGKTQLLRQLVTWALAKSRWRTEVAIIDFKGGSAWVGLAGLAQSWVLASDLDLRDVWTRLADEIKRRENVLAERSVALFSQAELPELLVFVDELSAAIANSAASKVFVDIASRGRSLGIFLVVTNQGISGIPRDLLLNLRSRIVLAGTDQVEIVQLGGKARELANDSPDLIAARWLRNGERDVDFWFSPDYLTSRAHP